MARHDRDNGKLLSQIKGEYREMPGLLLTEPQIQRMWGLDKGACETVVSTLVSRRVLVKTHRNAYARAEGQGAE